jgi:hypothetical protein
VESEIPVIASLDNDSKDPINLPPEKIEQSLKSKNKKQNYESRTHTVICIGRSEKYELTTTLRKGEKYLDFDDVEKDHIFVDDNLPIYSKASLRSPASNYEDPHMRSCEITHLIVPLHPKIYLDVYRAKIFIKSFLRTGKYRLRDASQLMLRIFLVSSVDYRDYITSNSDLDISVKRFLLEQHMPRFVYISELIYLSNPINYAKTKTSELKAEGLLIVDATENNTQFYKPLIVGIYSGKFLFRSTYKLKKISPKEASGLKFGPFAIFDRNSYNSIN